MRLPNEIEDKVFIEKKKFLNRCIKKYFGNVDITGQFLKEKGLSLLESDKARLKKTIYFCINSQIKESFTYKYKRKENNIIFNDSLKEVVKE